MNDKNKRKAVLGTIVATGLAAGMACNASPLANADNQASNRVTAADRIVINGKTINVGKALAGTEGLRRDNAMYAKAPDKRIDRKVRPMYGPPRHITKPVVPDTLIQEDSRVIEDVYGPPPVFDMVQSFDDVKDHIFSKVAKVFNIDREKVNDNWIIDYSANKHQWDEINADVMDSFNIGIYINEVGDDGFNFNSNERGERPTLGEYVEAIYKAYLNFNN